MTTGDGRRAVGATFSCQELDNRDEATFVVLPFFAADGILSFCTFMIQGEGIILTERWHLCSVLRSGEQRGEGMAFVGWGQDAEGPSCNIEEVRAALRWGAGAGGRGGVWRRVVTGGMVIL